ncbi:penicillin amidase [Mesorhizobium sp. L-8-10]|uniref:penicillin acylase family protein n=1 Tax=Mesorhizobium sp. L-8-10 TaxID=2744523 RepID=UPI001926669F|nr:penicillin acylase family protein [Mesorhizobium sp. L-8-10]BCH28272.1 penicillin amidase [Mesorhizobium sp. L-8-10]
MADETIPVAGLAEPASIVLDRWGIPHIRAESLMDMFFVQGFNAARDRLWQIDLGRKRGLGQLAADFGPGYLEQDRAARLFLYRGDMEREWSSYGDDSRAICERFVAGINAYIGLCEREPERLPPEFAAMGTRPARWQAEDVVRIRSHGWVRNAVSEVVRSNVVAASGAAADLLRQNIEPAHDATAGREVEALPLECLDALELATAPVTFKPERLAARLEDAAAWRKVSPLGEVMREAAAQGSNNWAVHGSRTDTGRPILAGDPHRTHVVPSLRYIIHMSAPGFDGIGAGEPSLPGISMGHNGTAGFGLTLFFGHDQEDVYTYETHPDDPHLYRYGDGWEPMRVLTEKVALKDGGEAELVLKFTRHGPVLAEYPGQRKAIAMRTVWLEPGTAPYFRSIVTMHADSFDAFRRGMAGWGVPATNQVYADISGAIGWVVAGFSPARPNWDGLLAVPGDGRFEWDGYLAAESLPFTLDPPEGYVATANEMNVPDAWHDENRPIGYEWVEPSRAHRIGESFAAEKIHSVESAKALQTDVLSIPARRLCGLLAGVEPEAPEAREAMTLLAGWDHRLSEASAAAALFEVWWTRHLRPAVIERLVPDPASRLLIGLGDVASVIAVLEAPADRMSISDRDRLLAGTLAAAFRTCRTLMGDDAVGWAWGRIHVAHFEHAVGAARDGTSFDVGPFPIGGSESTPMNAAFRPDDFRLVSGASFRMVLDVGDWDRSVCINTPGQSGDPRSPHYADLAPIWAAGDYVPMLYSRAAVDAAAVRTIRLQPVV